MTDTIGFIGLGLMGKPMAQNLLRAGYRVFANNRSRAAVDELVVQGAVAADSPRAVAEKSDFIITMLPGPETVARVIGGENRVLSGCRAGAIVIEMSTSSPKLARELAQMGETRGVFVLDAPVSGGQIGARDASLSIMVGGDTEAFTRALPILQKLGKNIVIHGQDNNLDLFTHGKTFWREVCAYLRSARARMPCKVMYGMMASPR